MAEAPAYQSFPVMSGDEIQLNFTVTDNDGAAVDLTAGSGRFAMARKVGASLVIDSDTVQASVIVTDLVGGKVKVTIGDTYTEALSGDYYWEFKWTDSFNREAIVARGIMSVQANLI